MDITKHEKCFMQAEKDRTACRATRKDVERVTELSIFPVCAEVKKELKVRRQDLSQEEASHIIDQATKKIQERFVGY